MKTSEEDKKVENDQMRRLDDENGSHEPLSDLTNPQNLPFPTISETLDMNQTTRIFMAFITDLNGSNLKRLQKGFSIKKDQKGKKQKFYFSASKAPGFAQSLGKAINFTP